MRIIIFLLSVIGLFLSAPVFSQLNSSHNHLRSGDILIKQQVEFKDPGAAGNNRLWDFSKLKTVNEEYTLSYSLPPEQDGNILVMDRTFQTKNTAVDELIVGTEHNTMYYYRLSNDTLIQLGHENPATRLEYIQPLVMMPFPLNYGQTTISHYRSNGLYSGTVQMQTQGTITTTADAFGKMILPSGDTLNPVLRVKTMQTIKNIPNQHAVEIAPENKGRLLETCRWYSKGYRYPVFETVRSFNLSDSTELFSTAFFFPPQEHLYLETDPENLALLDELWDVDSDEADTQDKTEIITIEDIISCKVYPNPVESFMHLEYDLKKDAQVTFDLYSMDGSPVKKVRTKSLKTGFYTETIDCSSLHPRNYVLKITVNNKSFNQIIIKK